MKRWTEQEIKFVIDNKDILTHKEIAFRLGRTLKSIDRAVSHYGIAKKQTGSRVVDGKKKCSKCEILKDVDDFSESKRIDGKSGWCKECFADYKREKAYGISKEEYLNKCTIQNDKCFICEKHCDKLYVDHCHSTGAIRDLLCSRCNAMLGNASDNPRVLGRAVLYLKRHGIKIAALCEDRSLSPEFLVIRPCCHNNCKNCPH